VVVLLAILPVVVRQRRHNARIRAKLLHAVQLGTNETISLHPVVDDGLCIGCEECVRGCPEQDVLATYHNKAVVLDAIECVGHGICERVCPVGAITLVVGTEQRGLEMPRLTEHFETNIPGIYVVGELGGMGLIRNAIWQGTQALAHIKHQKRAAPAGGVELLIVGAGPAGMAAALSARAAKIPFRVIEQETLGGSMLHYPRRKLVMTHPAELPGVGPFPFKEVEKEPLLAFWQDMARKHGIKVEEHTSLIGLERRGDDLVAKTTQGDIVVRRVVLALGRRGTPRKLDVPGEESAKVYYRLIEAHLYEMKKVAVIGGGSAGIEAALALAEQQGTRVTLVHRRENFAGARAALIEKLMAAEQEQKLEVLRNTSTRRIEADKVVFDVAGTEVERPNDFVFVMVGGVPPYDLLKKAGVDLQTKFGAPLRSRRSRWSGSFRATKI
jgi:thioredoxin reductase